MYQLTRLRYINSYLEWLKYKTAKPLLYMVYQTKPKMVRKEMIGKRNKLAVPKNS